MMLKVTQVKSVIGRHTKQKLTMQALGLRKINQTVLHHDTPQIRGMLDKVQHLVSVEEVEDDAIA
ncbi:MAG: 50S ribosomal protein L30 [Gemmatimonadetes bacterium]|nr:MAG: 50S ribosomal protein L30 [Gemmatimonadota bacterium]